MAYHTSPLLGSRHPARWTAGACEDCGYPIVQSEMIVRRPTGWAHVTCPTRPRP